MEYRNLMENERYQKQRIRREKAYRKRRVLRRLTTAASILVLVVMISFYWREGFHKEQKVITESESTVEWSKDEMNELIEKANRVLAEQTDVETEVRERLKRRIGEAQNAIEGNEVKRQTAYLNLVIAIADMEK